jgi:kynurenine formamidase
MTRIVDLSHPLHSGMPVFPGSLPVMVTRKAHIETHGFSEAQLSMPSHAGTHMDAPAHMIPGGLTLDQFSPDRFIGSACVLTLSLLQGDRIESGMLMSHQPVIESAEMILIHTGWSQFWGTGKYFDNYPVLSAKAASWLADFSPKAIGTDTASVDAFDAIDYPNHQIFFQKNIVLIENLCRLGDLPNSGFTLTCLPLLIQDADGSPARAVAMW